MPNSAAMTLFAQNTKRLLSKYGWTQKDLAEALGVHPQNLSRTLKGAHGTSIEMIEEVAKILDVDIRELFAPPEDVQRV